MSRKRNILLVVLVSLLFEISFAAQHTDARENVQPVENLSVVDGRGRRVGNVLGFREQIAKIALRIDGELAILNVSPQGFTGDGGGFLFNSGPFYFESTNCTGTPFDQSGGGEPPLALAPVHLLDGTKLYSRAGSPRSIIVRSWGSTSSSGWCQPLNSFQQMASPWRFLIDLSTQFQPPFTLR